MNVFLKKISHGITSKEEQQGAALTVSMILLVVMTLIGVTAVRMITLEEKMAGNMRDQNLAFQAAEAALRDGETAMSPDNLTSRPFTCQNAPCDIWERNYLTVDFSKPNQSSASPPNGWNWNNSSLVREYGVDGTKDLSQINKDPVYIIEEVEFVPDELGVGHGPVPGRHYYRMIARGTGGSDAAQAVIETTYTRRF